MGWAVDSIPVRPLGIAVKILPDIQANELLNLFWKIRMGLLG